MSSMFTHLVDGKRCWNEEGFSIIQSRLNRQNSRAKFIDLKSLLEESLCAVGFVKAPNHSIGNCCLELNTKSWKVSVCLSYPDGYRRIYFYTNGRERPLSDLRILWGILRKYYLESKVLNEK